jgi:hypothetical protein
MSLNDSLSKEVAERLSRLTPDDLLALVRSLSLGFPPGELHAAIVRVSKGEVVPVGSALGAPRPLTISAWSFVNDHGQFADTYGLSDGRAGELKGLLRTNPDAGVSEVTAVVTAALARRGSNRPVRVTRDGMPGAGKTDHRSAPGAQGGADLKKEITQNPTLYGMYKFEAEDTGRPGPYRYRVRLGSGLYAVFPSKQGAVDVAKICRVKGRDDPAIAGRVVFWRDGKPPLAGSDIPEKVTFDGRARPGEPLIPEPVSTSATIAE